jgi:hypothetical protein
MQSGAHSSEYAPLCLRLSMAGSCFTLSSA